MMDNKTQSKLLKLLALAKQGVGGEKENARRMLDKLLAKHNLSMADLESPDEETRYYLFTYATQQEKQLLIQVVCTVLNSNTYTYVNEKYKSRQGIKFVLTKAQYAELSFLYATYLRAWREATANFYSAFIHKNDIYPDIERDSEANHKMTPEEKERIWKIQQMLGGIDKIQIHKQLEEL